MKIMREEVLASLSDDYHVLKGINLNETLHKFMKINESLIENEWETLENVASDFFIYSRSNQADHLYYLFDQKIIQKLVKLIHPDNI
jgi:hypothetical protein